MQRRQGLEQLYCVIVLLSGNCREFDTMFTSLDEEENSALKTQLTLSINVDDRIHFVCLRGTSILLSLTNTCNESKQIEIDIKYADSS